MSTRSLTEFRGPYVTSRQLSVDNHVEHRPVGRCRQRSPRSARWRAGERESPLTISQSTPVETLFRRSEACDDRRAAAGPQLVSTPCAQPERVVHHRGRLIHRCTASAVENGACAALRTALGSPRLSIAVGAGLRCDQTGRTPTATRVSPARRCQRERLRSPMCRTCRSRRRAPTATGAPAARRRAGDATVVRVDRTPPQDMAAEQSVLGAMLLSKDAIADVTETAARHRLLPARPRD